MNLINIWTYRKQLGLYPDTTKCCDVRQSEMLSLLLHKFLFDATLECSSLQHTHPKSGNNWQRLSDKLGNVCRGPLG